MFPDTPRDESDHPMTRPGDPARGAEAPAEEGRQPEMSQASRQPRAEDPNQGSWLIPDPGDDIVVSRVQGWE